MMRRVVLLALFAVSAVCVYAQSDDRQLFLEAEGRFQSGDYELALDRYTRLIQDFPLSSYVPDAQYRRAVCEFQLGRWSDSLALLKLVATRYPYTRYLPYVPFWSGLASYELGRYADAVDSFNVYLSGSDAAFANQALLYKSISERMLKKPDAERATLERLVSTLADPASMPYAVAELANLDLDAKRYQDVLTLLANANVDKIASPWAERLRLYEAEAYFGTNDLTRAEALYTRLLNAPVDVSVVAFQRLFAIYQATGQDAKLASIVSAAEVALAGQPEVLRRFWQQVGVDSYKRGDLATARTYFEKIWDLRGTAPVDPIVPLYLADLLAKNGRAADAANVLESALAGAATPSETASSGATPGGPASGEAGSIDPAYRDLMLFRVAGLYLQLGQWGVAQQRFDGFLQRYPTSPYYGEAAYLDALAAYRAGNSTAALSVIERVLGSTRGGSYATDLVRLRSTVYKSLGDTGRAIQSLEQYLQLSPDDTAARVDLVKYYFEQKSYSTVLAESARILSDTPDFAQKYPGSYLILQYMKGLVLINQKNYDAALAALAPLDTRALAANKLSLIDPYVQFYRGWAFYRSGNYAEAGKAFEQLLAAAPENPFALQARYLSGWSSYLSSDYASAAKSFLKYSTEVSASASGERERGLFMYAKSLAAQKSYDAAEVALQGIFTDTPQSPFAPDAMFEYAGVLALAGDVSGAAGAYSRLADRYPQSALAPDALYKRAELLLQAKQYGDAQQAYYDYRLRFPDGKQVDAALYYGGQAALAAGEDYGALLQWQKLIDGFPKSPLRADTMLRAAQLYERKGDLRNALKLFNQLITLYPREANAASAQTEASKITFLLAGQSPQEASLSAAIKQGGGVDSAAGRTAMIDLAQLYLAEGGAKLDLALPLLDQVAKGSGADLASAARARYDIGEFYSRTGDYVKAANEYLGAATVNPSDVDLAAESMYRAAQMANLAGHAADVSAMVARIVKDFPGTEWAVEAKKLLGGAQ